MKTLYALTLLAGTLAPLAVSGDEPKKTCHCSASCTCGCNQGEQCRCLNATPRPAKQAEETHLFGVDADKLGKRTRILRGDKEITRTEALRLLGDADDKQVPDDRAHMRLTVIGPEAERKQVVAEVGHHPALAGYKGKLVVNDYPPDHWAVAQAGFKVDGRPTVYLQSPDGTVLHRQDTYQGPEHLAQAIRKADPSYDPSKDPDATRPAIPGLPDLSKLPPWVWIAGAVGLYMLMKKDK